MGRGAEGHWGLEGDRLRKPENRRRKRLCLSGREHTQGYREQSENDKEKQRKKREKQAKNVTLQWNLETAQAIQIIRRLLAFKRIDSA